MYTLLISTIQSSDSGAKRMWLEQYQEKDQIKYLAMCSKENDYELRPLHNSDLI